MRLVFDLHSLSAPTAWGEVRAIAHSDQKEIAKWIDDKNYEVVSGPIVNLVLKDKFLKSDPIPTFTVGTSTFEYGVYSRNRLLQNHLEGGPLFENREVTIWHRDGEIMRLYVNDNEIRPSRARQ